MATVYVMVGLPSSGKTYWARTHANFYDEYISSDSIRAELWGDASIQSDSPLVFSTMFQRTCTALKANHSVLYDATNIKSKRRANLVKSLKKRFPNVKCVCVLMVTPLDLCFERNAERSRVVPVSVIERMLHQFEPPYEGEGWDHICVEYNYAPKRDFYYYEKLYEIVVEDYGSQDNSHHSFSLMEHCKACGDIARKNNAEKDIIAAAYIHDYGKPYTATMWEKDNYKETHYPSHQNVGAYLSLIMGYDLHVAQLVALHMIRFTDEKYQVAWRARVGKKLWKEIQELGTYDAAAH